MSSAFPPTDEGDESPAPGLPKPIRLSEVPQIAERSKGGVDGALKEAFALRSADVLEAPEPAAVDRVEAEPAPAAAAEPLEAASVEPPHPAQSVETTPAADKLAESPVASEPTAAAAPELRDQTFAELATAAPGDGAEAPHPAVPPLATDAMDVKAPAVADSIETERLGAGAPADTHAARFTLDAGEPGADAASTAPPPPVSPPLFHAEPTTRPYAGTHAGIFPLELTPDGAVSRPQRSLDGSHHSEAPATARPLAGALDTAAKLAADANAAAEALENLKRLLERQLPDPAQSPPQPLHEIFAETRAAQEPPPLPVHEPLAEEPAYDEEPPAAEPKPFTRPGARNAPWRERRQFDVRGFLAGFALSWAIGAALYIYLTAG